MGNFELNSDPHPPGLSVDLLIALWYTANVSVELIPSSLQPLRRLCYSCRIGRGQLVDWFVPDQELEEYSVSLLGALGGK